MVKDVQVFPQKNLKKLPAAFEIIIFLNIKFHKLFNFYLIDVENSEKFFEKLYPFKIHNNLYHTFRK
jgi:hypothetical protein